MTMMSFSRSPFREPLGESGKSEASLTRMARVRMVEGLIQDGDLRNQATIEAMLCVRRHLFVPADQVEMAYDNYPLPIGHQQTISQPAVVAMMTEALELTGRERILEIGTGCGYQAAILSLLAKEVYTIERIDELAAQARARLQGLGFTRVAVRTGDGYMGWPEQAPFDRIMMTAAPAELPLLLVAQLAEEGIVVAPVGGSFAQQLIRGRKVNGVMQLESLGNVRFVPMLPGESRSAA